MPMPLRVVRLGNWLNRALLPYEYPGRKRLLAEIHYRLKRDGATGNVKVQLRYGHQVSNGKPIISNSVTVEAREMGIDTAPSTFSITGNWTLPTFSHFNDVTFTFNMLTGKSRQTSWPEILIGDKDTYQSAIQQRLFRSSALWTAVAGLPALALIFLTPLTSELPTNIIIPLALIAIPKFIQAAVRAC